MKRKVFLPNYPKEYKPSQLIRPEFKAYNSTKIQVGISMFFVCFLKNFAICGGFEYIGKGNINCYYKSTSYGLKPLTVTTACVPFQPVLCFFISSVPVTCQIIFSHPLSHFSYIISKLAVFVLEMFYCFKYFGFAVCIWKANQLAKWKHTGIPFL